MAMASGALEEERLVELADVVAGGARAAGAPGGGVTIFKSVGAAFEDLVVAAAAVVGAGAGAGRLLRE